MSGAWAGRWARGHVRGRAEGKAKTKRGERGAREEERIREHWMGWCGGRGGKHHGGTCIKCYPKRLQFLHRFAGLELQTDASVKMYISHTKLRGNAIYYTGNGLLVCRRISVPNLQTIFIWILSDLGHGGWGWAGWRGGVRQQVRSVMK